MKNLKTAKYQIIKKKSWKKYKCIPFSSRYQYINNVLETHFGLFDICIMDEFCLALTLARLCSQGYYLKATI